jgi:hypothetical protein
LKPGTFNLDLLKTLYGTPDSPLLPDPIESQDEQSTPPPNRPPPAPQEEEKEKKPKDPEDRRGLRGLVGTPQFDVNPMPQICLERARLAEALCDSDHCITDVGYGYTIHINKSRI